LSIDTKPKRSDVNKTFVINVGADGMSVCREETPDEIRETDQMFPATRGPHRINHLFDKPAPYLADSESGLTIILRAMQQLEGFPDARAAFMRAAAT
jgi:hypothetical protein